MTQRILQKSKPVSSELDRLIFQLESSLGKPHSVSPFDGFYAKHGFSTDASQPDTAPKEQKPKEQKATKKEQQAEAKPKKAKSQAPAKKDDSSLTEELKVFRQCDLRVGKIIECKKHEGSDKLYVEKIDLGEEGGKIRTILSGLQEHIPIEEMLDGQCVVFANLKERKLAGIGSEGMVMCGQTADKSTVELMRPPKGSKVGERIQLEGDPIFDEPLEQELQPILNPKRKIEGKLIDLLKTNDTCEGTYNGIKLVTCSGVIKCKSVKSGVIA